MNMERFTGSSSKDSAKNKARVPRFIRNAIAGVGLLGAAGASHVAVANESSSVQTKDPTPIVMEKDPISTLSPNAEEFLNREYGRIDSGVTNWKEADKVPFAWRGLDEKHLQALVAYINEMEKNSPVRTMLDNRAIGALPADLAELIQAGTREILKSAGYGLSPEDVNYFGNKVWRELAQETIYKIY